MSKKMGKAKTASEAEEMSKNYRIFPKKYFGQNFLVDKDVLSDIIKTSELKPKDIVVEIGPGLGILTRELAKKAGKVITIEKDERLVKILKDELGNFKNIEIISGDILELSIIQLFNLTTDYKVVANLPYYIASPVIRKFLETEIPPKLMVLMVQKEVAERICARPPEMSVLAVAVQLYSVPKIVRIVEKESFWPKPKVDGAIIKLKVKSRKLKVDTDTFFKIVKAGFSSPRKQLKNNLKAVFGKSVEDIFKKTEIDPRRRAETLSVEDWMKIYNLIKR